MNPTTKSFGLGFTCAGLAAALANLLPYLMTRGAYNGDGFEVVGFPFTFRRVGGLTGIREFSVLALLADAGLALFAAAIVGYAFARVRQRKEIGDEAGGPG